MSSKISEKCDVHLEGSPLTRQEAQAMVTKLGLMEGQDLDALSDEVKRKIMDEVETTISSRVKKINDMVTAKKLFRDSIKDAKNPLEAAKNRLKFLVGRNSLDSQRRMKRNALSGNFLENQRLFRTHENKEFKSLWDIKDGSDQERQLWHKIRNIQEELTPDKLTPEKVNSLLEGADELDRIAYAVAAHNAYMRKFAHRHGIGVRYDKNYVIKRRYDPQMLEALAPDKKDSKQAWLDLMMGKTPGEGLLDLKASFGNMDEKAVRGQLLGIYSEIEADQNVKLYQWGSAAPSKSESSTRKFVFKDADAEYEAFKKLSAGGLAQQVDGNAYGLATSAVKIQNLGYNSEDVIRMVDTQMAEKFKSHKMSKMDAARMNMINTRIKQAEADFTGGNNYVNSWLTDTATAIKTGVALTKLGNAVATAMLDVVDTGRQVFYVNGSMFGGYGEYTKNFWKVTAGMGNEQRQELAENLGVIYTHISSGEAMRLAKGDLATSSTGMGRMIERFGDKAFNLATLLPAQTGRSKIASALVGAKNFAKLMDKFKNGESFNKFEADTFKEYGFTKEELYALAHDVERAPTFSAPIITAKNIRDSLLSMEPEALAKKLNVDPEEAGEAALALSEKYQVFLNDFFTRGTPTPELATKTLLLKGSGNELANVTMGLVTQFMDTPVAQAQNLKELMDKLARVHGVTDEKFVRQMAAIAPDFMAHSAVYLPIGLSAYVAYDFAFSAAIQKESFIDKWSNGSEDDRRALMLNAIGRTSYMPFVAELIENQTSQYYNVGALDTFKGPALSLANDLAALAPGGDMEIQDFLKRHSPNAAPFQLFKNVMQRGGIDARPFDDDKPLFGSGL